MSGDLKNELAVPALVEKAAGRRPLDRETTEDKRTRREPEILSCAFALQPHTLDGFDLPHPTAGNDEAKVSISQQRAYSFQSAGGGEFRLTCGSHAAAPVKGRVLSPPFQWLALEPRMSPGMLPGKNPAIGFLKTPYVVNCVADGGSRVKVCKTDNGPRFGGLNWRDSQVVRPSPAKRLFVGSIPTPASKFCRRKTK